MTEEIPAAQDLDDARLLDLVRAGDADAYGVLFRRHEQAARRLARELVVSPAEIDDVVAETFARVLDVMRRGGGPTDAFRPYVLTATRRVCYDRIESQRKQIPAAAHEPRDPGDPFVDTAVASLDRSLIARAFMSLPERWSAVLWHTEIERASLAEVAPIFGLTRNSVAALRQRAKEGLRHAYLQMYLAKVTRPECTPVAERLGAFVRDSLSKRETAMVSQHLDDCEDCRAAFTELTDVNSALRSVVAPIFLGDAAASYLATAAPSATAAETPGSIAPTEMTLARVAGAGNASSDPIAGAGSGAGDYAIGSRRRQGQRDWWRLRPARDRGLGDSRTGDSRTGDKRAGLDRCLDRLWSWRLFLEHHHCRSVRAAQRVSRAAHIRLPAMDRGERRHCARGLRDRVRGNIDRELRSSAPLPSDCAGTVAGSRGDVDGHSIVGRDEDAID